MLQRHAALHTTDRCGQKSSPKASKACPHCAAAKVKCQDEKPCRRCRKRGLRCGNSEEEADTDDAQPSGICESSPRFGLPLDAERSPRNHSSQTNSFELSSVHFPTNSQMALDGNWLGDVSRATSLAHCNDSVIERLFEQGYRVFNKSIWTSCLSDELSTGASKSFTEDEPWLILSTDINLPFRDTLTERSRDSLLSIFSQNNPADCQQLEFPSLTVMNILVHRFLTRQDSRSDSWIHSPTFATRAESIELVGMAIAASALNSQFYSLRQFGHQLHKTLQPVILRKVSVFTTMLNGLGLLLSIWPTAGR